MITVTAVDTRCVTGVVFTWRGDSYANTSPYNLFYRECVLESTLFLCDLSLLNAAHDTACFIRLVYSLVVHSSITVLIVTLLSLSLSRSQGKLSPNYSLLLALSVFTCHSQKLCALRVQRDLRCNCCRFFLLLQIHYAVKLDRPCIFVCHERRHSLCKWCKIVNTV